MLEVKEIRENKEAYVAAIQKRFFDASKLLDQVISLDDHRKSLQQEQDAVLAKRNSISKEIGQLFQQGKPEEASQKKQEVEILKATIGKIGDQLADTEKQLFDQLVQIPNIPHETVVAGKSDTDNVVEFTVDAVPELYEKAVPHWELTSKYDIIDFEAGVKLTGAGFPVYKGMGAKLQRALIQFFLDEGEKAGYLEIQPPLMVNKESGFGTGQLPDKEGQMYYVTEDDFYLIPTAEVPITNLYRDEIVEEKDLPIKLTGYTPCFRREAGSYGKDVRGLNRLHQFDKVEIVQMVHPNQSYNALEEMKGHIEMILQKLELPYRILRLCGGDLTFTSALTFDFETYSAAQERWLEVSSVSNFETFQSNRMKIRYRPEAIDGKKQKTELLHTLNGSALALPRILATLLENNQSPEGIRIPKVLQRYTGFELIN